ncbi:hypothetical protein UY3_13783 [Chelonia mydas]|uniref:Uncharacterized protein n=1 Tax=Chelonia mydas TaxID=8469 RepID=M7AWI0_CHEMY|nr:hypothetical protein UY3_13783 [Chelonia mydas]
MAALPSELGAWLSAAVLQLPRSEGSAESALLLLLRGKKVAPYHSLCKERPVLLGKGEEPKEEWWQEGPLSSADSSSVGVMQLLTHQYATAYTPVFNQHHKSFEKVFVHSESYPVMKRKV